MKDKCFVLLSDGWSDSSHSYLTVVVKYWKKNIGFNIRLFNLLDYSDDGTGKAIYEKIYHNFL